MRVTAEELNRATLAVKLAVMVDIGPCRTRVLD